MKRILTLLIAVLLGSMMYAQSIINNDYYYQDFEDLSGWSSVGEWGVDEVFQDAGNMAYIVSSANTTYNSELQSPAFLISNRDGNGKATFYTMCYSMNGGTAVANFQLLVSIDGFVYTAGTFSISSNDGWALKTISFTNLAPYLSANGSNVQFVIVFVSSTADAYVVLDDFEMSRNFMARLLDPSQSQIGVIVADADSNMVAPAYTGYVPSGQAFAYWAIYDFNGDPTGFAAMEGDVLSGVDQNLQWLAIMGDVFVVSYNANGGTGTMSSQQGIQYIGHTVMSNSFTRDGYSFTGWNTKADGTGDSYAVGDNLANMDNDYNLASTSVTLYAQWILNTGATFNVAFDANGGSGTMQGASVNAGAAYVLPFCSFTRGGYAFSHWNTDASGNGTSYAVGSSVNINSNMTFYAQWVEDSQGGGGQGGGQGGGSATSYTIHFDANGGTGIMNDVTVGSGQSFTIPSSGFTRSGYSFLIWNSQPDGNGVSYGTGVQIPINSNLTLYAIWQNDEGQGGGGQGGSTTTYTVNFVANGGTGIMSVVTVNAGQQFTIPSSGFVRDGYSFIAWNTMSDGSGISYVPGNVIQINANLTLYAQWRANGGQGGGTQESTYTVRYNANGGSGSMPQQEVTDASTIILRSCQFVREGYMFVGWNTAADGSGASYSAGDEVEITSDMTFYAQWRSTSAINSPAMASVSIYPNPTVGMVVVNGTMVNRIDVIDLAGCIVRTIESSNSINLSGLFDGVYTLRIVSKDGIATRKVVKK